VLDDLREQLDAYAAFPPTPSYWDQLRESSEVGLPLLVVGGIGLLLLLRRPATRTFTLASLVFAGLTLAVLIGPDYQPVRNLVPLLPLLCVGAAIAVVEAVGVVGRVLRRPLPGLRPVLATVLVAALCVPLVDDLRRHVSVQRTLVDSRVQARQWLERHVDRSDAVLVAAQLGFLQSELDRVDADAVVRPQAGFGQLGPGRFDYVLAGVLFENPFAWSAGVTGRQEVATFGTVWTSCPRGQRSEPGGEHCPAGPSPRAWHANKVLIKVFGPREEPATPPP
jgi:hypothetical protein